MSAAHSRPARIHPACPTSAFPVQVGGKWTGMAVLCLAAGPLRFGDLRAQLAPVSAKVLAETLRDMQRRGFVRRHDHEVNPPNVEYELTALGRSLIELIDAARDWGRRHPGIDLEGDPDQVT
ncbi:winged helix-turn-helix transcriptional regulator [Dactylosporangium sp. CA-139066]|uniref:winged helix-turn-helix transcriptional regulator n=1 Tax=Dactylosporangium sp. CA-139066 TaxID=3239930 RepID=UPI003D8F75DF